MEEDLKILEGIINLYKNTNELPYKFNREIIQAIENLIQENKELNEKAKNTMGLIGANYIHKDKVREKIKELEQEIKDEGVDYDWNKNSIITVLQELLEEE